MKKVVITGATSMIGVACVESCLNAGMDVLAIVRPGSNRLSRLPVQPGLEIVACALDKLNELQMPIHACDVFFHLAWEGTAREARIDPAAQERNIRYALDAVWLAKRLGCEKFVGIGSQAEYGPSHRPLGPDAPVHPSTAYGAAKYAASILCGIECDRLGMQFNWARVFSIYGLNDSGLTLISALIQSLRAHQVMPLTACEQMWDYLYATDCGRALRLIGERGKDQATYCVGSGEVRPLSAFVRAVRDEIDPSLPLGFGEIPYGKNQVMFLCADIRTLMEDTGFRPKISFEEGIRLIKDGLEAEQRR